MSADPFDPVLAQVHDAIERTGWAVYGVHPTSLSDGPWFGYTVGLTAVGLPEFIVYGLPPETGQFVLNELAIRATVRRAPYRPGEALTDLLDPYDPTVIDVVDTSPLKLVRQIYGAQNPVRAQQVIVQDRAGKLPWEPGYDRRAMGAAQPLLGVPPEDRG